MLTRIEKQLPVELSEYIFYNFVKVNRDFCITLKELEENTYFKKMYFNLIYTKGSCDIDFNQFVNYFDGDIINFKVIVNKVDNICKNIRNMKIELQQLGILKYDKTYKKFDISDSISDSISEIEEIDSISDIDDIEEIDSISDIDGESFEEHFYIDEYEKFKKEFEDEVVYSKKTIYSILNLFNKYYIEVDYNDTLIQYLIKSYVYVSQI